MTRLEAIQTRAAKAASFVRQSWPVTPRLGIILGTGSGQIAERISVDAAFDYSKIPDFPQSTALGHKGRLVCGSLFESPVIAMQGRFHPYEGHGIDAIGLPLALFHELGIDRLLITNAVGGVNPKFQSGELMAITSHLDLMMLTGPGFESQVADFACRPTYRADAYYDAELVRLARATGRKHDFVVHQGTYAGLLGPNYETRAEYRMLRRLGGDVAGMSTVPEVAFAALFEIPILALSVVTNVAKPDALEETSGQEVIDAAKVAEPNLLKIVEAISNKS